MDKVLGNDTSFSMQERVSAGVVQFETGIEQFKKPTYSDTNSTRLRRLGNPFSTSTADLWLLAERRFKRDTPSIPSFVNLLHHISFEDGMSNEAIELVKKLSRKNPYLAITWLYSVYGSYQSDSVVIDSLLRIIAFLELPQVLSVCFIPMLRLALMDTAIDCQESAIMLCEVWRTKECYDALKDAPISDPLLKDYAETVKVELSEELYANAS